MLRGQTRPVGIDVVEPLRRGGSSTVIGDTVRPSSCARSQWRDAFSATGPLTPKWVQSIAPRRRTSIAPSIQTASSTSCDTPDNSR